MPKINQSYLIIIAMLVAVSSINSQILDSSKGWIKLTHGLDFPEGPAFDGVSSLYFSNCYGGWIGKFSEGKLDTFVQKNDADLSIEKTNGLAIGPDGFLYGCDYGKGMIFRYDRAGNIEIISDGYQGQKYNRPNDLVFTDDGNLFFTDPKGYGEDKLDGRIFYIDLANRQVKLLKDSLAFPNGINISPIDKKLYVCESA
jgi:gluconolactonase